MGDRTKRALSQALGELLEEKPLDKITISSITDRCVLQEILSIIISRTYTIFLDGSSSDSQTR